MLWVILVDGFQVILCSECIFRVAIPYTDSQNDVNAPNSVLRNWLLTCEMYLEMSNSWSGFLHQLEKSNAITHHKITFQMQTKQNKTMENGSSWWFNWWSITTEYHATFNCLNKYVELNRTQTLRCQWRWQMFAFTIENYENQSSIVNSNQPSAIHSMHYFLLRSFNLRLNMLFQQHSTHIFISIGWNWYSKWFVTFTLSTSPQSNHCECKIIVCFVTHSIFCISVISTKKQILLRPLRTQAWKIIFIRKHGTTEIFQRYYFGWLSCLFD